MSNQVFFGQESMSKMLEGMAIGANSVSVTMGGNDKTVFIYKKEGHLEATLDGVSVITSIRLKDQIQDAGLKMIQEVSSKTASDVGDSTTGSSVLFYEMCKEGFKLKQAGVNCVELKNGMYKACASIVETIMGLKKDIGKDKKILRHVAATSAHNDKEIGQLIGDTYEKFGKNVSIIVEASSNAESNVDLVNGFQFLGGFFSQHFINTENNTAELINPYILIVEGKIEKTSEIWGILELVVKEGRDLVIMAEDFTHDVARDFHLNVTKTKALNGYLIKHEFTGETKDELLFDLCAITNATLVTSKKGVKLESINTGYLGQCEKIVSDKKETIIYNGKSDNKLLALRIDDVNKKIASAKNIMMREKYEIRLSKLLGVVAIYYVGGNSHTEVGEKMARIDDAIKATRCAVEMGVVAGGGTALIRCIENLNKLKWENNDERAGIQLVQKSIEKPLFQIVSNSGKSGELIVEKVKESKGNYGYNCKTDKIEDLFKAGIIDPAKVVIKCVENAVSGAAQFLISECAIVDEI